MVSKDTIVATKVGKKTLANIGSNITIFSESALVMNCNVTGVPPPTVTWFKNSKILGNSSKVRIDKKSNFLEISRADEDDEGSYTCIASNVIGSETASSKVNIIGKPFSILYSLTYQFP